VGVIKMPKKKDFTIMPNHHFRDKRLSFKAKGLMSLMLSLPSDWDYTIAGLVTLAKDGRDSVNQGIKELEECGYLTRTQSTAANGKFSAMEYTLHEKPQTEKPLTEKPLTEKPLTENR